MKHLAEMAFVVLFLITWIAGMVVAKGFWSTAAAKPKIYGIGETWTKGCLDEFTWYAAVVLRRTTSDYRMNWTTTETELQFDDKTRLIS